MNMIPLLFLLGFTLHNIEEAIWLPAWSETAGRFQKVIRAQQFYFTVIMITALGYLLTFQYLVIPYASILSRFAYLGFVAMMVLNVIFPHLAATAFLKKYAPGTATGLLLNMPIGLYILIREISNKQELIYLLIATGIVTLVTLAIIKLLFKLTSKLSWIH